MQTQDLVTRHCKQPKRVVVTQVRLCHERELRQVFDRLEVIGMDAFLLATRSVGRHVVVCVAYRPFQTLKLQR